MNEPQPRRTRLERIVRWTAAGVLAFVLYLAGGPVVVSYVMPRYPWATPVLYIVYAPLALYFSQPGLPGVERYSEYERWCRDKLQPPAIPLPPAPTVPVRSKPVR